MKHAERALTNQAPTAAHPVTVDFSGHWVNELGSYMDLTLAGNTLSGNYVSAKSKGGGATPPFPIVGTVSGDLISWTVNWGVMITAWVGHGVIQKDGTVRILTLWQIIQVVADETDPGEQWKTVLAGADEFW